MSKAKVLVVGDLNFDYLGKIPFLPEADEEVAVDPLNGYLGGSGANFSVVAARLGLDITFYSAVGKDASGQHLLTLVEQSGVSTEHIKQVESTSTGMVFGVIEPNAVRRLFCYRGANLDLCPEDILNEDIKSSSWVHLNGPEYHVALNLLSQAREANVRTSMDPGSILLKEYNIDELLPLTSILFLNEVEFLKLSVGETYLERAEYLHQKGVEWIALKCGSAGSILFQNNQIPIVQNAFEIEPIDSTGAGDAFNAGFVCAILNGYPIEDVLKFANALGALTTMSMGATSASVNSIEEIWKFIRSTNFREINTTTLS